ncbi:MAG: phosphotransferase [Dehalococcoidia bacterium]
MIEPQISDDELVAGVRAVRRDGASVRIKKRKRLRPTAGLTGSYFERVQLEIAGAKQKAILKQGELPYGPPTREHAFFATLAHGVPMRVPALYGIGPVPQNGGDGWVLMEALPRGRRIIEWAAEETPRALRNLAALHAQYLGAAPAGLVRPFTRDLAYIFSFLEGGIEALRQKYAAYPHFPRAVGERSLELASQLAQRPDIFRRAFERSPETLLHGDYHRGNLLVRDGEPHVVFDWQFVCAGPPAYDLAVFWLYMGAVNKPGFLRFFDRIAVVPRDMTWQQVLEVYCDELSRLRPDADIAAITSCADHALAWEPFRQLTYMGRGLDNFAGYMNFIYRDHRKIGGWFARWVGIEEGFRLYGEVFADFEERAERLLASG